MAITYQVARGPVIPGLTNQYYWYVNQIDDSKNPISQSDPMVRLYAQFLADPTAAFAVANALNGV